MAIVKFINSKSKLGNKSLRQALDYIDDSSKTRGNPRLVGGIAKNSKDALMRMEIIKKLFHKTDKRQYIHFVISPQGKIEEEKMLNMTKDVHGYYKNFYSFYAIHQNTDNTHVHFILNSVGLDGKKFNQSKREMKIFKDFVSRSCLKYNIEIDKTRELINWYNFANSSHSYIAQSKQFQQEYRPHINDMYKPSCYRLGVDGNYHPVNPVNSDGTVNMIQKINPDTDIVPMIYTVDDKGYLTPGMKGGKV